MGLQRVGHNWATFTFTVTALKSAFLTEFSFYPSLRCWWVTGLGPRPDLSDVRARALNHDFVHTHTHTHTHTHIPLTQQPANGEIWTVSTTNLDSNVCYENILDVLTFHSSPQSSRPGAHSRPLGSQTRPLHSILVVYPWPHYSSHRNINPIYPSARV